MIVVWRPQLQISWTTKCEGDEMRSKHASCSADTGNLEFATASRPSFAMNDKVAKNRVARDKNIRAGHGLNYEVRVQMLDRSR